MTDDFYLLWLLLPVAALSGWWLGRRSDNLKGNNSSSAFNPEYFKGLNFVLK